MIARRLRSFARTSACCAAIGSALAAPSGATQRLPDTQLRHLDKVGFRVGLSTDCGTDYEVFQREVTEIFEAGGLTSDPASKVQLEVEVFCYAPLNRTDPTVLDTYVRARVALLELVRIERLESIGVTIPFSVATWSREFEDFVPTGESTADFAHRSILDLVRLTADEIAVSRYFENPPKPPAQPPSPSPEPAAEPAAKTATASASSPCGGGGLPAVAAAPREPRFPVSEEVPAVVAYAAPTYTEAGRRARIERSALIDVWIDAEGRVVGLDVAQEVPMGLDKMALEAARAWRFNPSQAKRRKATLEFVFQLDRDPYVQPRFRFEGPFRLLVWSPGPP